MYARKPLNSYDTDSYIEKCFDFVSEMILSFLYPQFNIDGYILS